MAENIDFVVVDCSIVLAKILPDEDLVDELEEDFEMFIRNKVYFISPNLLVYEVMNAVKSALVSGRINKKYCTDIISNFSRWDIKLVDLVNYEDIIDLATLFKLSVYDSSYLYLAKKYKCRLLTLDKKLFKAFKESNI